MDDYLELNVISAAWEKSEGNKVTFAKTNELQDLLSENPLFEVSFRGNTFTWLNKRFNGFW